MLFGKSNLFIYIAIQQKTNIMTYEELKHRLNAVETTLQQIQTKESVQLTPTYVKETVKSLTTIKENLLAKLQILEASDETMFISTKGGDTKAVKMDRKTAMDLKKDPAITGIDTAKGAKIKERLDSVEGIEFTIEETKAIAKQVGKALIKSLKQVGDEIARIKAHRIEENSFDIHVQYKDNSDDEFSFYITEDTLHLVDFSFDKELVEVGVKPSGEAILNVDVLTNELLKHFKSLSEGGEDYDADQEQKNDEEDHGVGYDDDGRPLGEGEGDDHHYIKVKAHDYKKAMAILNQNVDPTYVKMEVVDNDGAGNVVIYFIFKHESGFDDMYDDSENQDSEFYQEPDENPDAFVYDVVMDLRANDIELADHSADMDEALDINDPVLIKLRAKQRRDAIAKHSDTKFPIGREANIQRAAKIKDLETKRAQVMRDMEQEAEPEGGPIADRYGSILNKIDQALLKLKGIKQMDYHTAVGLRENIPTAFDDENMDALLNIILKYVKDPQDAERELTKLDNGGFDAMSPELLAALDRDSEFKNWYNKLHSIEDTDYMQRRRQQDDYYQNPDYYRESKNMNEIKAAKIQQAHSKVVSIMKDLAKKYKAGDKSVVDQLKTLTVTKKKLEAELERAVAGTHHGQELDEKQLNEYASRNLDEIFGALGYRQGFDEFIEDNPGCVEVIMEWIGSIPEFRSRLTNEYEAEELERLGFYDFDEDDFNEMVKEGLNPEVSKKVAQFVKAMAKRYDYSEQDAVFAIQAALKQRKFDRVYEENTQDTIDRLKARIADPNDGGNVPFLIQKIKKLEKEKLDETKKSILKEFTDNRFKGSELIDDVSKRSPDMFNKQLFADLLPKGIASENDAIEALKAHDKSPIKARMGQYAPMFVHVQYHDLEHEGEEYQMHQTQYYNSNFKDKDPSFNPGVSKITLIKDPEGEDERLGTILVKTDQYVQDLRNIPGLGKRVSEAGPGFKHDCAAKVVHEKHGKGTCIPEKHTLVKEGKKYVVTHYDVLFESGKTVEDIPVSELEIKTQTEHWHKGYKKKKK